MRKYLGLLKKSRLVVSVILVFALAAFGTEVLGSEATPKYGGTLNVGLCASILMLAPQKSVYVPFQRSVMFSVWEPLVRYVAGEEVYKPLLAESWEYQDDVTLIMHLRQGVKFHDGTIFDSFDVKFTIERMQDPETAAAHSGFVAMIDEVVPLDPYTVEFRLSAPFGGLLTNLDYIVMLNNDNPPDPDRDPVGTGPFRFVEWIPGDHLTLERFPDYWQEGLPYLDKIVFTPISDGQTRFSNLQGTVIQYNAEVAYERVSQIEADPNLKLIKGSPGGGMLSFIFVTDIPPMDNVLVRRAVAHCVDRQGLVDATFYGFGIASENIYSSDNPYYNLETEHVHPYDIEMARTLFEEAGYPENFPEEAYPLKITIQAGLKRFTDAAVILQSSLREAGIELVIEQYDSPTWRRVRETRPIIVTAYSYGSADPSAQLSSNLISQEKNLAHYYDEELAQLIEDGYRQVEFESRKAVYNRIQEKLADEVPISPIVLYPWISAAQSYVEGIWLLPAWSLPIFHEAWLNL